MACSTMLKMSTPLARTTTARASTQSRSLVSAPLLARPACFTAHAPMARSAVITQAGPVDRFSKQLKKKSDYDPKGKEVNNPTSAFTRRRELFVGRLAMTGFFALVVGEILTGKGVLGQLSLETSLPRPVIGAGIVGIVLFNTITALSPGSATFSEENQQDVRKRPAGPTQKPGKIDPIKAPKKFLGISQDTFGFTKANELFVGRVAMLGFAADLIGEYFQGGKGPLGQLGIPMPAYSQYAAFGLAGWILFFFAAAIGTGNFPGEQEGAEDIY